MNRYLTLLIAFALLIIAAGRAEAATYQLTVVNQGNTPICDLYISPTSDPYWGEDWLGDESIETGDQFTTSLEEGNYDLLARACDGLELGRINGAYINDDGSWTIAVNNGTDRDRDGIPNVDDLCPYEAEIYNDIFDNDGCPDNVTTLVDVFSADINTFWANSWTATQQITTVDLPYVPPTTVSVYFSETYDSAEYNAFYSGRDHAIYYDFYFLNDSVADFGDAAAVMMLAHEYGHLVQANLGLLANRPTIDTEQEADCLAGAYFHFANQQGYLEEGDLEEALNFAYSIGTAHEGTHGTHEQRLAAFTSGFEGSIQSCLGQ